MQIQHCLIFTKLCLAFVSIALNNAAMADGPMFKAGAAMSNITPSIASNQTAGSSRRQATHVHDELHLPV